MKAGKRSRGVIRLVAAAALAACCASPAAAKGALPDEFFGVVPLDKPTAADVQQMRSSGVATTRLPIRWGFIEPQPGVRDWSEPDSLIGDMARAGIRTLPLLFGVPSWVSPRPAAPPINTAAHRAAWSRFLSDVAARYGSGGTFWQQHPELPPLPVRDWEVWNEANLRGFWDGKPDPRRYLALLKVSRQALRASDPTARIVLGGLFPHPRRRYGVSQKSFLTRLYRAPGARAAFDAVGIHPFAARPKGVLEACLELRRLMAEHRDRRTPIWITELGWTTGGVGFARSPYRASELAQARRLTQSFRLLIKARRRLRLERIFWHSWRDLAGAGQLWTVEMGLLRSDGTAKPSLAAFSAITR
jgi:hypothetical protein